MEIVPGIRMVDGSVGCNTYLIIDDGVTLIDTGLRGNVPKIYGSLERINHRPKDIRRIVLTHAHLDHINCLPQLKEDTGAAVLAGDREAEIITGQRPLKVASGLLGVIFGLFRPYYRYRPVSVDVRLKDGDRIPGAFDLEVVCLPGHSAGNLGLYSRSKRVFFCSDALRVVDGRVAPPSARFTADMASAIASIRRIGELDFDVLLPGHGAAVTRDAAAKVRELHKEISK